MSPHRERMADPDRQTIMRRFEWWLREEQKRVHKFGAFAEHDGRAIMIEEALAKLCELESQHPQPFECADCGRPSHVHVWLDEATWRQVRPDHRAPSGGVLCLYCMSDRLEGLGYEEASVTLTVSNGPFCTMPIAKAEGR